MEEKEVEVKKKPAQKPETTLLLVLFLGLLIGVTVAFVWALIR